MIITDYVIPIPESINEEEISMGVKKGRQSIKVRLVQDTQDTNKVHGFNAKFHFGNPKDSVEIAFNKDDLTYNGKKQEILDHRNKKHTEVFRFYKKNEDYLKGAIYYAKDLIMDKYLGHDDSISEKDIDTKFTKYSKLSKEEQEKYQEECNARN